jgi:hypothetical protein
MPSPLSRLADGLILLLFLAVPLAASPCFWDQFTTVKWYVLEVLTAIWFLFEVLVYGQHGWPAFVRRWALAFLGLAGLVAWGNLRGGLGDAAAPLLERATFVLLVLCFFWYDARTGGRTAPLVAGTALATAAVDTVGLAQAFGATLLRDLTAADKPSSFLGNVNMTAQYLGFAILILVAAPSRRLAGGTPPLEGPPSERSLGLRAPSARQGGASIPQACRWVLIAVSLVYLFLLSSRSVLLALFCATAVYLAGRRISVRSILLLALASGLVAFLLQAGPARTVIQGLRANKWASLEQRLTVGRATLQLIREHPLGVGSGNFAEALVPYRSRVGSPPSESLVFLHPHNEYLRVLAEEGVLVFLLAATLVFGLVRELRRRGEERPGAACPWLAPLGVYLAVESFFQFPLALAYGALVAAALLGRALAALEPSASGDEAVASSPARSTFLWKSTALAASLLALLEVARVAGSEYLFVNRRDETEWQDRACGWNPRNRPACVQSAWLHARSGDSRGARERLLQVLDRAPYYLPAIKLLGEEALVGGERETGCLCLWIYDGLLRWQSSLHDRVQRTCDPMLIASFRARIAMPHYQRFPAGRESLR